MNRKKKQSKMAALIEDFSSYTGSKKSYCALHNIKVHAFDYYSKKQETTSSPSKSFLPIQVQDVPTVSHLTINYPNGNQILLPSSIPLNLLSQLVQSQRDQITSDV